MDGVLCKFDKSAPLSKVFAPGYSRELEPQMSALELARKLYVMGYDVRIGTKYKYPFVKEDKLFWVNIYAPWVDEDHIIFIPLDGNKADYFDADCILIDDFNENLDEWAASGRTAIKFINGINSENPKYPSIYIDNEVDENIKILKKALG